MGDTAPCRKIDPRWQAKLTCIVLREAVSQASLRFRAVLRAPCSVLSSDVPFCSHHIRLFAQDARDADRTGNFVFTSSRPSFATSNSLTSSAPGAVVDTTITHT